MFHSSNADLGCLRVSSSYRETWHTYPTAYCYSSKAYMHVILFVDWYISPKLDFSMLRRCDLDASCAIKSLFVMVVSRMNSWVSCSTKLLQLEGQRSLPGSGCQDLELKCSIVVASLGALLLSIHASSSLLFLYEGIRNLFTAVDGGNDDQEGAACNNEAEFAVADVAFVV
jgi:hypothetical protein